MTIAKFKAASDGKFKQPRKRIKMSRTIEDIAALVPLESTEHYTNILLNQMYYL